MARWKADRSTQRDTRRAETNAVAVYPTALRAPKVPARSRARLVQRRTRVEQWLSEGELPPNEELRLVHRRLDIDAGLARLDQADRLPELEETFATVAASWCKHNEITGGGTARARRAGRVLAKAGVTWKQPWPGSSRREAVLTVARKLYRDRVLTVARKLQAGASASDRCRGVAGATDVW